MNTCKICGKLTKNKSFCSINCKSVWQSKPKNSCIFCGKTIDRLDTKYCSCDCYQKDKKQKYLNNLKYNKCIICGKETLNEKYCSMKCLGLDENRKKTAINNLPNIHVWSESEINYLKENYGKTNINEISDFLKIDKNAIIAYCSKHNIVSQRKWTEEEKRYILEHNDESIENLSIKLDRSKSSIINQFSKLNGFNDYSGKSIITPQDFVFNFVKENFNIPILNNIQFGKYTTDILVYNLDIEVQGAYWHNDPRIINDDIKGHRKRDEEKRKFLKEKNILVLYVWEYDIISNPKKVKKDLLKNIKKHINSLTEEEKEKILQEHKQNLLKKMHKEEEKIASIKRTLDNTKENLAILGWPNSNI